MKIFLLRWVQHIILIKMYCLTRLECIKKDYVFGGLVESVLIELYIDYRTYKKYILNKICWADYAYIREYAFDELINDDMFILPYDHDDECIYGKNPSNCGCWRISSNMYVEDCLTENDI